MAYAIVYGVHTLEMRALRGRVFAFLGYVAASSAARGWLAQANVAGRVSAVDDLNAGANECNPVRCESRWRCRSACGEWSPGIAYLRTIAAAASTEIQRVRQFTGDTD